MPFQPKIVKPGDKSPRPRRVSKTPVSSFDPILLAALLKGGASPLEIHLESSAAATKLVQRLYAFRKRLRDENHPHASRAQRAKISNQSGGKHTSTVRISPHDFEYREAFRAAGIAIEELKDNLLEDLWEEQQGAKGALTDPINPPSSDPELDPNLLSNLFKEMKE